MEIRRFLSRDPSFYSRDYFLSNCGGYDLFQASRGQDLDEIRRYALELADVRRGTRVLDIGCGRGELATALAARGASVIAIDFSYAALQLAREALAASGEKPVKALLQMDARRMGFSPIVRFDRIIMTDVVEHLTNDEMWRLMSDCKAMLSPEGRMILHTSPTKQYVRVGQHVFRLLRRLRGQPVPRVISEESEFIHSGHCYLHSARSLRQLLAVFPHYRVWHRYTSNSGAIKGALSRLKCTTLLTRNLWGLASLSAIGAVRE